MQEIWTHNQCRFTQTRNKQSYQRPKSSQVEVHLAEEVSEDDSYPTKTKNERNDDDYDDIMQDFLAEALTAGINAKQKLDNTWYFDTGATHHRTNKKQYIKKCNPLPTRIPIVFGNNGSPNSLGKGDVNLLLQENQLLTVDNFYFVPGITKNLLSICQATKNVTSIKFEETYAQIKHKTLGGQTTKYICKHLDEGLYRIPCTPMTTTLEAYYTSTNEQFR